MSSWLQKANWDVYIKEVRRRLQRYKRTSEGYLRVLRAGDERLPLPWRVGYLDDIERRRIIGGLGDYGWLGHIYASGRFRHLVAKGETRERTTIVNAVNNIAALNPPIDWTSLEASLRSLVQLRFTMKVWGRLLTLVRPDIYCTVASPSVRTNLARVLDRPLTSFETPEGYVALIKHIHTWPWFNSQRPADPSEGAIWKARVAFLDALFYEGGGPQ